MDIGSQKSEVRCSPTMLSFMIHLGSGAAGGLGAPYIDVLIYKEVEKHPNTNANANLQGGREAPQH
jgi:hypothetical protein